MAEGGLPEHLDAVVWVLSVEQGGEVGGGENKGIYKPTCDPRCFLSCPLSPA